MAQASRHPIYFAAFLGVLLALIALVDSTVKMRLYPADEVLEPKVKETMKAPEKKAAAAAQPKEPKEATELPKEEEPSESLLEFEEGLRAYKMDVLSKLAPGEKRMDVVVRYYPHAPDGDAVYRLEELGYYLHERPTDPGTTSTPSNSLFYGDDVPVEDVQLVAITLLDAGIPLRQIVPSKFHADWKAGALEIGADQTVASLPILTKTTIRNFRK